MKRRWGDPFISRAWAKVNEVARGAYERELLSRVRLPCRVISVGNLQAGGTGKTPLVMKIAREAIARGLQPCILSRGYASPWERSGGVIQPHEQGVSPYLCGDEVTLIHERVPEAWIAVGADRVAQFQKASGILDSQGKGIFDLAILDDGLQHWRIERDLDIVALSDARFGETLFRERFSALGPKNLLVLTEGRDFPEEAIEASSHRVKTEFRLPPPVSGEGPFFFVCGLGDPERALQQVRASGYRVEREAFFRDHHSYSPSEVERLLAEAQDLNLRVLVTGKDWVKWKALGTNPEQVRVIEPEIAFREGEAIWNRLLWGE